MKTASKASPAGAAPAPAQPDVKVTFVPHSEKPETKNCYRFDEQTESGMPPKIGTLYVQKWALGNRLPDRITLVIQTV